MDRLGRWLDTLDGLRSVGCKVLSFTILREPLSQALSDLHYFRNDYARLQGNVSAFLHTYVSGGENRAASRLSSPWPLLRFA